MQVAITYSILAALVLVFLAWQFFKSEYYQVFYSHKNDYYCIFKDPISAHLTTAWMKVKDGVILRGKTEIYNAKPLKPDKKTPVVDSVPSPTSKLKSKVKGAIIEDTTKYTVPTTIQDTNRYVDTLGKYNKKTLHFIIGNPQPQAIGGMGTELSATDYARAIRGAGIIPAWLQAMSGTFLDPKTQLLILLGGMVVVCVVVIYQIHGVQSHISDFQAQVAPILPPPPEGN